MVITLTLQSTVHGVHGVAGVHALLHVEEDHSLLPGLKYSRQLEGERNAAGILRKNKCVELQNVQLVSQLIMSVYFFCYKAKFLLAACSRKQFTCASRNECIPAVYKCDGDEDCDDGSDEHNCPVDGKLIDYSLKSQSCGSFQMWKVFRFYLTLMVGI